MGGLSKQPLGYRDNSMQNFMQLAQMVQLQQYRQGEEEDRKARIALQTKRDLQDQEIKQAAQREKLFSRSIETASGLKPDEIPQVLPYFSEASQLMEPGATSTVPTAGGNLLVRPYVQPQNIREAAGRGAIQLQEARTKAGELLPQDEEGQNVRKQIAAGLIRVPSQVPGAYEKALEAGQKASTLRVARETEGPRIEEQKLKTEKLGYETYTSGIEAVYKEPILEGEVAEKRAAVDKKRLEVTEARIKLGQEQAVKGSPIDIENQEKQEDLNKKRADAQRATIEFKNLQLANNARDQFIQTGDIGHLHRAILYATNGAIDTARLIQSGDAQDLQRMTSALSATDRTMALRVQLQEAVNKKDLTGAQSIVNELNNHSVLLSSVLKADKVDWTSVRQEEGMFGKPIMARVTMTRQEALGIQNGMIKPDTPQGLGLLLKANFGDLVNRAEAGDPLAYERLIRAANTYPGVTRESAQAVETFLRQRMGAGSKMLPSPGQTETPNVPQVGAPRPGETLIGAGAKTSGDPYAETRRRFGESLGTQSAEGAQGERRNDAAIKRYRRPYTQLTPQQRATIDSEVP